MGFFRGESGMIGESALLIQSVRDFLSRPMLRLALLPFLIVGALTLVGFFMLADMGLESMGESTIHIQKSEVRIDEQGAVHTEELNSSYRGNGVVSYLFTNPVTSGIMSFLVYSVGGLAAAMLSIYAALAVIGFLTPLIIRRLHQKHHPGLQLSGYGNPLYSLWLLFKTTLVAVGIFILLIPLYFIPGINLLAFNLPFYYLFHKQLSTEIASEVMSRRQHLVIREENKNRLRLRTLLLYLLSLLPFVWLFIPVFYVIYLGNGYLNALARLQNEGEGESH